MIDNGSNTIVGLACLLKVFGVFILLIIVSQQGKISKLKSQITNNEIIKMKLDRYISRFGDIEFEKIIFVEKFPVDYIIMDKEIIKSYNYKDLKLSIKELGILIPLDLTDDYKIIHGKQRYLVIKDLGLNFIPVNIYSKEWHES